LLLPSIFALLAPLAIYCWILANINGRIKPTIVSGFWDGVGLLLALSGILLVVCPLLLKRFFLRALDAIPLEQNIEPTATTLMSEWWFFWFFYFAALVLGVVLMLWRQRKKTVIYNVDPQKFCTYLHDSLDQLELEGTRNGDRLVIVPKSPPLIPAETEVAVEIFPAMFNASLHWLRDPGNLRKGIEKQLARNLESAQTFDNPSTTWFLAFTGLLFGLIFLTAMVAFFTAYFPPWWHR